MTTDPHTHGSDLRGASRLAFDAVNGVIGAVEATHGGIGRSFGLFAGAPSYKTSGITGLIYRTIHGVTHLAGAGTDLALRLLDPVLGGPYRTPARDAACAVLNGIVGDHLAATANPLAIRMSLRHGGRPLQLEKGRLEAALSPVGDRVAVMVHGLCLNDRGWKRNGHDHGVALVRDLGYTTVYLNYNSGLHIADNGRAFAELLETLVREWPVPLKELTIIGHSMGGLVARSACHYGAVAGHDWPGRLRNLVFLGSPHHGAPLERGGQWLHLLLGRSRYMAAFSRLGRVRSAGITDLRHGNLLDGDRQGGNRFEQLGDRRTPVPLPEGVRCYAIAAATAKQPGGLGDRLLGDGLVPLASALGHHDDPGRDLCFPVDRQLVVRGRNHFDLLSDRDVYDRIKDWLSRQPTPGTNFT
jgi:pimeloyl-ACP methyl ester carboxylesterase